MATTFLAGSRGWDSASDGPRDGVAAMRDWSVATCLHWILRIGMLWCFVGHGAFGIIGKEGWLAYYDVFGLSHRLARDTMPIIGLMDISIGVITLIRPMRAVLLYAIFWTALTAVLRPLAGQGLWQEVAERGGNYGLPLALLLLVGLGGRPLRSWFESARPRELTFDLARVLGWAVRICIALLLIGHGGFGVTHLHDPEWIRYFDVLGIGSGSVASSHLIALVGWFEIALGLAVLVKPFRGLILFVLVWKLFTELLRPLSGEPIWELIERGGDYFLPLALFLIQGVLARRDSDSWGPGAALPAWEPFGWTAARPSRPPAEVAVTTWLASPNGYGNGPPSNGNGAPEAAPRPSPDLDLVRAATALRTRITSERAARGIGSR